jgi:GNAT superfamily N-acetyltransferase
MNAAIRIVAASARDEVGLHLLQLSGEERRLRFGKPLSDAAVAGYVDALDFSRDKLFGVFEQGVLAGLAQLALRPHGASAELGVSVSPGSRCRGYGYALLRVAAQQARRIACRRLDMHCLVENRIMVHLARKAGLVVVSGTGAAGAYIALGAEPADAAPPAGYARFFGPPGAAASLSRR